MLEKNKQVQLGYFRKLCVDFSHCSNGVWSIFHLMFDVKTSSLTLHVDEDKHLKMMDHNFDVVGDLECGYFKIPIQTDIQYVVRNLITIALTRVYDNGFDTEPVRILDVFEKGKK